MNSLDLVVAWDDLSAASRAQPCRPLADDINEASSIAPVLGLLRQGGQLFSCLRLWARIVPAIERSLTAKQRLQPMRRNVRPGTIILSTMPHPKDSVQSLVDQARSLARSDPAKAHRLAQRALVLTGSPGVDPDLRATSLRTGLQLALEQKHFQEAETLRQALEALLPRCSAAVGARCKNGLGWDAYSRGDLGRALTFTREALGELTQLGQADGELWARNNLAAIYSALGSRDKAVVLYVENRERARALGNSLLEGGALLNLALENNTGNDFPAALEAAEQGMPLLDGCQDIYARLLVRAQIVNALLGMGRLAEARQKCDDMLAMHCPIPTAAAMLHFYRARTLRHHGDHGGASAAAQQGLRMAPRRLSPEKLLLWTELALAHEGQDKLSLAWQLNKKILAGAEQLKLEKKHFDAVEALARLAERRGRIREALHFQKRLLAMEREHLSSNNEKQRVLFTVELALDRAKQEAELARMRNVALEEAVTRDGMTELYNHATFKHMLQQFVTQGALSLVMLDVDDFKSYNDSYGHPAGDALLKALAALLQGQLRDEDRLARYGGEEFALLLPGHDAESALAVAERLRRVVATHPFPHRQVTVSIGVAATPPLAPDPQALVEAADRSLYEAKRLGKDRVVRHTELAVH